MATPPRAGAAVTVVTVVAAAVLVLVVLLSTTTTQTGSVPSFPAPLLARFSPPSSPPFFATVLPSYHVYVVTDTENDHDNDDDAFQLRSPTMADGDELPLAYTCLADDGGVSPPLYWRNTPTGTTQLLLMLETDGYRHDTGEYIGTRCEWTIYNISPTLTAIDVGNAAGVGTPGGTWPGVSKHIYNPPCPETEYESADKTYYFTLVALSGDLASVVQAQVAAGDSTADIGKNMAALADERNMVLGKSTLSTYLPSVVVDQRQQLQQRRRRQQQEKKDAVSSLRATA